MESKGIGKLNHTELVSIITPVYNCEKFIGETIESVLAQTYSNWEMIIVNDKSTDNTRDIIVTYTSRDSRIRLIDLAENSGTAVARNTSIGDAKGRFIAFLDSDDRWKKDKLAKQLDFMIRNNYGFTFTNYEYILDKNNHKVKVFKVCESLDYNQYLKNTLIGCLTVMLDKNIIGDFSEPLVRRGQDNLTWLMILDKGHKAYGLDENLAEYRRAKGSLSYNKLKAMKRQWVNYRKVIKLPILKCLYYYSFYAMNSVKKYYLS